MSEIDSYCKEVDSKTLAANVVVYRLLAINKELAIVCMQELYARRENGDDFKYEEYIERQLKEMPSPNMDEKDKGMFAHIFNTDFTKWKM
jgi:hypothetical protein